jgi:hypothetical protein
MTYGRSVVFSEYSGFLHNKTDHHDITEILLKVALNTINQPNQQEFDNSDCSSLNGLEMGVFNCQSYYWYY